MKLFLQQVNARTLFLIDEMGTGSDPELGGAIAEAVLEALIAKGAFGAVTTHYSNLKLLAQHLPVAANAGDAPSVVVNASMKYDTALLQPLYELVQGAPGSSYTFEVAQKMGLPPYLLQKAKNKVARQKVRLDALLHELEAQNEHNQRLERSLLAKEETLQIERQAYTERLADLEEKIQNFQTQNSEQAQYLRWGEKYQKFVERWLLENTSRKEILKSIVLQLNSELVKHKKGQEGVPINKVSSTKQARSIAKKRQQLSIGARVKLKGQSQMGYVLEIGEQEALVRFGDFLKLKAKIADLIILL